MKKIIAITTLFLSSAGIAFSAPEHNNSEVENTIIDERFKFDFDDFDPTTAFIGIDDGISQTQRVDAYDVIEYAKNYIGRPYSRGSKGPKAFDCSGFTSYVFRNFDISLSASSSTQSKEGVAVSRNDIQPGDLLFFRGRSAQSGVGHVAIAIEVDPSGEVTFIHAATSKGIRIDKLNSDPYYRSRYVCARRVLD